MKQKEKKKLYSIKVLLDACLLFYHPIDKKKLLINDAISFQHKDKQKEKDLRVSLLYSQLH